MKKPTESTHDRLAMQRRDVLLGAAAALLLSSREAAAQAGSPRNAPTDLVPSGGAATPVPADLALGKGKDRALVLGGGGEYFIAWLIGFAHGLGAAGVPYQLADMIVGTSAGAVVGCALAADHLGLLRGDMEFFGTFPRLLTSLVPTGASNLSQIRAREICEATHDASIASIQSIGRGAMAARNPSVIELQLMIDVLSLDRSWPDDGLLHRRATRLVAIEPDSDFACRVRERLLARRLRPDLDRGSAVHGWSDERNQHPRRSGRRRKRALVVALTDVGQRFSHIPNDIGQELKNVEAAGTKTLLIAADPGKVHLLSPAEIESALKAGHDRAVREADRIKAFWV